MENRWWLRIGIIPFLFPAISRAFIRGRDKWKRNASRNQNICLSHFGRHTDNADVKEGRTEVGAQSGQAGKAGWAPPSGITIEEMEKLLIAATLQRTGGNIKEAAGVLGIDRSTLYEKIKRYEIPR